MYFIKSIEVIFIAGFNLENSEFTIYSDLSRMLGYITSLGIANRHILEGIYEGGGWVGIKIRIQGRGKYKLTLSAALPLQLSPF